MVEQFQDQFHALKLKQTVYFSKTIETLKLNVRAWDDKTDFCCLFLVYLVVDFDFVQC